MADNYKEVEVLINDLNQPSRGGVWRFYLRDENWVATIRLNDAGDGGNSRRRRITKSVLRHKLPAFWLLITEEGDESRFHSIFEGVRECPGLCTVYKV
jgi:hypothetical protein